MRVTFIILLLTSYLHSYSQVRYEMPTDTLLLKNVSFKKTIAYKLEEVTLLVDFEEYRKALDCRRLYNKQMRQALSKDSSRLVNEMREGWLFTDSLYQLINAQAATQDTIFLTRSNFRFGLTPSGNFFPDLIESGKCAIVDENNKKHFLIIRGKWSSESAYGISEGRTYYLPGHKRHFMIATDRLA
jgi:hypothetical protein